MPRRTLDLTAPYQPFRGASRITGFSIGFLRDGCKNGTIPHVMAGKEYRICMPLFLQQLEAESAASVKLDTKNVLTGAATSVRTETETATGRTSFPTSIVPETGPSVKQKGVNSLECVR